MKFAVILAVLWGCATMNEEVVDISDPGQEEENQVNPPKLEKLVEKLIICKLPRTCASENKGCKPQVLKRTTVSKCELLRGVPVKKRGSR